MNKYPINDKDIKGYGYKFGVKTSYSPFHLGTDFIANTGVKVYAKEDMQIIATYIGSEGGLTILARTDKHWFRYMHLSKFNVGLGKVKAGTVLGFVGSTGSLSTAPHLHIDITDISVPEATVRAGAMPINKLIDPIKYFDNLSNNENDMIKDERFWLTTDRESKNVGKYRVIGINNEKAMWCAVSDDYLYSAYVQDDHKVGGKHLDEKIIAGKKKAPFRDVIFIK